MTADSVLVAVCGLPGVGKSTVSARVTECIDGVRLRTDEIRKELIDEPAYTDSERARVYEELFSQAEQLLERGESVVLDATFAENPHRRAAKRTAQTTDTEFRLIHVVCDQDVAERRIAARDDISDADVSVYREFQREFDPLDLDHVTVDNSESLVETHTQVDSLF